jgi:DNA-binding transcriptional LysR family regulator
LLVLMSSRDLVGIMPRGFFEHHAAHTELVELPIEDPLPIVTIHAVSRADAPLTIPAQRLLDAFLHEAAEHRARRSVRNGLRVQPARERSPG